MPHTKSAHTRTTLTTIISVLLNASIVLSLVSSVFLLPPIREARADITSSLVGHWTFDGDTQDSSGQGNNGTAQGEPTFVAGKIGQALQFDVGTMNVNLGNSSALKPGVFSVSAWARPISANATRYLLGGQYTTPADYSIRQVSGTGWTAHVTIGGADYVVSWGGGNLTANQWYHIVSVYDGEELRIYVDGVLRGTNNTPSGTMSNSGSNIRIGTDRNGFGGAIGTIDDVRIYNRALSSSDITELHDWTGAPADSTPPVRSNGSPSGTLSSGTTQTTLSLTTDENATCRYSTTAGTAYSSMTNTFSTTGNTSHSTTVSGLSDGNTYTYYVRCQDGAGNANTIDFSISFSVAVASSDITAPTQPTNLSATAQSSGQINLSWTASTDPVIPGQTTSGVTGYRAERCQGSTCNNFAQIATPSGTSYSDTGLTANITYRYRVRATDAAGNPSNYSTTESATTESAPSGGVTEYYVDNSRASNGDGSSANPWQHWNNIDWSQISNAVASGDVHIYFSSRDTWLTSGVYTVGVSGNASHTVSLIGDEKYNLTDSGIASWQNETTVDQRARLANTGGDGSVRVNSNSSYIKIKGFHVDHPVWGGINLGVVNPTVNIHHITIENNFIDTPTNNHGVWFGYAEDGTHDVVVRNNVIQNTKLECVYMGHYNYMGNSITGIVVENNTLRDCGLSGEGDIDIKPAVNGAIIRYNKHYRTAPNLGGSNSGIVVYANNAQIYGNELYNAQQRSSNDWGFGIFITADGDGAGNGQGITSTLIYNNLIYGNDRAGIRMTANTSVSSANITGVRIYNNVVWNNGSTGSAGVQATASGGRQVVIDEMRNNIIGENTSYDVYLGGNTSITSANHNLYYRSDGNPSWYVNGARSWSQWQGMGYDANGYNTNPQFLNPTAGDFNLTAGSPAIDAGATLASVPSDIDSTPRPQGCCYDIGAYEYVQSGTPQPLVGDLNQDGTVNALDWGIMNSQWFTSNPQSDINGDGLVNSIDFGLMNKNWGLSS
jgi:hypothetical protein